MFNSFTYTRRFISFISFPFITNIQDKSHMIVVEDIYIHCLIFHGITNTITNVISVRQRKKIYKK